MAGRTRKQREVQDSLSGDEDSISTPTGNSAASDAKADAARSRRVSLKEAAAFLDRDRNTVMKWLDQGCPYVDKADRDLGKAWVLDLAEVVRWLERRASDATAEKLGLSTEGKITREEADRRTAIAKMTMAEREAAESLSLVVPISVVIDRIAKDYNELRGRLMTIPDAIAGQVNASVAVKVREVADKSVRAAIASLKANKDYPAPKGE